MSTTLVLMLAGALGLIMGSAVTAIAWRVPRGISWFSGRSACPSCQTPLGPLDLVPLLSFVFARGRSVCVFCWCFAGVDEGRAVGRLLCAGVF